MKKMVKHLIVSAIILALFNFTYGQNRKVCLTSECLETEKYLKEHIDDSVNPCDNFYRFACGKWLANTQIPSQYQLVSTYSQMQQKIDLDIKALLEKPHNPVTEKNYIKLLKNYHAQCIDTDAIDSQGVSPLVDLLKSVGDWPHLSEKWSCDSFDAIERTLNLKEKGIYQSSYLLKIGVSYIPGDIMKNAFHVNVNKLHMVGAENYQKGLESELVKYEYEAMLKIADILGVDKTVAVEDLRNVQQLKVHLANAMSNYGEQAMMTLDELNTLAPNIEWRKFIEGITNQKINNGEKILVNQPQNIKAVNNVLATADKRTLANLMMYNVIAVFGEYVGKEIRSVVLDVRGRANGILENDLPRWKVCLMDKSDVLDIALSSFYIINNDFPAKRDKVIKMFDIVQDKFADDLKNNDSLDDKTKSLLVRKIKNINKYLLHPDEYLSQDIIQKYYEELTFDGAETMLDKQLRLSHLQQQKIYRRLREKNHNNWEDFRYALNIAFNYFSQNNAAFMTEAAFYLPLFSENRPNYLNYGSAGFMMGHVITHIIDTSARNYDENGMSWEWSPEAEKMYKKRTQCLVNMYNNFSVNGVNINGSQTLDENMADVLGMDVAYRVYKKATKDTEATLPGLPYSQDQLFWISSANVFCAKYRNEYMTDYLKTNIHSPPEFRANGAMMNSKAFADAFQCPRNSFMNPSEKC